VTKKLFSTHNKLKNQTAWLTVCLTAYAAVKDHLEKVKIIRLRDSLDYFLKTINGLKKKKR